MADFDDREGRLAGYRDPESAKMRDWSWRPLKDVDAALGGLTEIPSHVEKFGEYMDETAGRAARGELTPRDLIKAYVITRASIQRRSQDADRLRSSGLILPPGLSGQVRPEGAMGHWLHSKMGQQYLDAAEKGIVDHEAVADAQKSMRPFGLNAEMDALPWAANNLPDSHKQVASMVARSLKNASSPAEWRKFSGGLRGIGTAKAGFVASMMGRGDQPTLDARQVVLQTGKPTSEAKLPMARAGFDAVDRLAARQSALNLKMSPDLEPFRQHLTHHAIWDKAGNEETTHDDVINAMRYAATGGAIKRADGGRIPGHYGEGIADHPLARALAAIGLPGLNYSDPVAAQAALRITSPTHHDPDMARRAIEIAQGLRVKTGNEAGSGAYYNVKQTKAASDVKTKIEDIPGVTPKAPKPMTWEQMYQETKGGTLINVGGDRSNLGRLTHVNGKKLKWPVDLHAGPKYMLEPNPGAVWANSAAHTEAFNKKIREAAKSGPVYGIYSPMGPQAVDSSHNMFDAVMAQIDKKAIDKKDAAELDGALKAGLHMAPADRANGIAKMEDWPGILNPKKASEFARNLPGKHRSGVIKFLDKSYWRDRGLPHVGETRAAITDPDVMHAPGNMLGHRLVQFDPDTHRAEETAFSHSTYTEATPGQYIGDIPLLQRQYVMPDASERLAMKPTKSGDIVHPYSTDAIGRATARKMFEEQKQLQPINEKWVDSVGRGEERKRAYGFARGGAINTRPSDAQKEAGNYQKGHISYQGLPISIENPKGSMRSGTAPNGKKWSVKMPYDYGYIKRTEGADGDHIDVCIGPNDHSHSVFVVDQMDIRTGKFDEHKVMLGFDTREAALASYHAGFSDGKGRERVKSVVRMTVPEFKTWLRHHDTKKPVRGQSHIDRALSSVSMYDRKRNRDAG